VLKKDKRISRRKEFEEVKARGKLIQMAWWGVIVWKKDKDKKFGWVISKKVSKKAVERNKIKRLLAEAVRRKLERLAEGTRMIFLVKRGAAGRKMADFENEINKLIK
jgi:ribonuclease P protein component